MPQDHEHLYEAPSYDRCRCGHADPPAYEWRCFGTIVCDPLVDRHGRECERLNDEAREEFYADLVAEDVGHLVEWHARQALGSARVR